MCRFFVVIDDIWNVKAWDIIKFAFPMISSGSIIITTTRINEVAESCCSSFSGNIYGIKPLNMVHSRELFHRRLFYSRENCPPYLEEVSDQILKKCDGLPLAIIAISGLLANTERTEYMWNQVKDSIGRALQRNPTVEGMMNILSLSYFDLLPHLKTCLLYVSIFPEDSNIYRTDLIKRWIGEGFIHKQVGCTVHETGERYFNELLNRGLILPGDTNEYGEVESCRVHDIILDFIISKSKEENFVTFLSATVPITGTESKVIRRLSLQGVKKENPTIMTEGLDFSHVRSVSGAFVKMPSLEKFRHLRVLHLYDFKGWGVQNLERIGNLFQLRYLSYRYIGIRWLPEHIGRLGCLKTLDIRKTDVRQLPASIVNLRKLSHLFVDYGVKFPDGVAKMEALETLKEVGVFLQTLDFLSGLGQLKKLRNLALYADSTDTSQAGEERNRAIVTSLCELGTQNLLSLHIGGWSSVLLEPLCELTLEKLVNCSLHIPQIPKWLSCLRNLQKLFLQLQEEGVKQDDLCMLGALPALDILDLTQTTESNEEFRVSGEVGFQSLRIFICNGIGAFPVDLMFAPGSMPKLQKLLLYYWRLVETNTLGFGIENLPCLSSVKCKVNGDPGIVEVLQTAMENAASAHPNHPTLLFQTVDTRSRFYRLPSFD